MAGTASTARRTASTERFPQGTRVRLVQDHGLIGVSGDQGVVVSGPDNQDRYAVDIDTPEVKPRLFGVPRAKLVRISRTAARRSASSETLPKEPSAESLSKGTRVRLVQDHGLIGVAGDEGAIVSDPDSQGRYAVDLDTPEEKPRLFGVPPSKLVAI